MQEQATTAVPEQQLIEQFQRRITQIEQSASTLEQAQEAQEISRIKQQQTLQEELAAVQTELQQVQEQTSTLLHTIFSLGKTLQSSVTKRELEHYETTINEWELEAFLRHDELEATYARYATPAVKKPQAAQRRK